MNKYAKASVVLEFSFFLGVCFGVFFTVIASRI